MRHPLGLLAACIVFAACEEVVEPVPEPALVREAVVGGQPVQVCQFPSTVTIGGCTATLIHPRVVTTAAHCLNGSSATVRFGGNRNSPGSFTLMGRCRSGASGSSGVGASRDWGYCVIPEDDRVKQIPYTPPLVGCEAERYLKAGASGWVVGYGTTGPSGQGSGVKRAVEVKINRVSNGTVDVGDKNVGACHGDSGGPIYMQIGDGSNDWGLRVFGSTSGPGAARCDCTCSTLYVDIANHVKAIEANEDIDVTPCTDETGRWAPGPDCKALQTAAMMGSGTFPACTVGRTTAAIDSCGMGAAPAAGSGGGAPIAGSGGSGTAGRGSAGQSGSGGTSAGALAAGSSGSAAGSSAGAPAAGTSADTADSSGSTMSLAGRAAVGGGAGRANIGSSGAQGFSTGGSAASTPAQAAGGVAAAPVAARDGGCSAARRGNRSSSAPLSLLALFVLGLALRRIRRPQLLDNLTSLSSNPRNSA